jgi:hypothetical protein
MSLKGFPNQKKPTQTLTGYTSEQSHNKSDFVTVQPTSSDRFGLDSVQLGLFRIHPTPKTATPVAAEPKRIITSTAHGASKGDVVRFLDTAVNANFEAAILTVPDANTIILASETPLNIIGTDTFYILRYVTPRYDVTGATISTVVQGPVSFNLNAVPTEVSLDTSTPSNSIPLPIINLNPDGTKVTPATAANQTAQSTLIGAVTETAPGTDTASSGLNGRLQRVAQRITSLIGLLPTALGSTTSANSLAVTQSTEDIARQGILTETPPATDTASSGQNGRLQRIAQRLTTLIGLFPTALGSQAAASSLGVALSSEDVARQGIITETAPATDTASSGINGRLQRIAQRLTSLIALLPASLGQKAMAASLAVTVASDQTSIPVSISDVAASSTITTQNLVPAGTATANSAILSGQLNGQSTINIQVTGAYTGALSLQGTLNNTNWVTIGGLVFTDVGNGTQTATIPSAATSIYQADCAGFSAVRVTALGAVTGTATITIRASAAAGLVGLDLSLPAGANIIGTLTANQTVNAAQINGVAPLMGAGSDGTGSQRVTHASGATGTLANVASSATTTTLLAASTSRLGATITNESTSILYLKFGGTASATSYTVQIVGGGYYELPGPHIYNGIIDGIWASANGNARVTSW